jgi:hypothetical protein
MAATPAHEDDDELTIDTSLPHSARVYDWWLGGKDNYPADRALGEAFIQAIPTMRFMAKENRNFMIRAARFLAREAKIRQFLDIGTGIPTSPNLHEVTQAIEPTSRIVYIDNDPIVMAHSRALMVGSEAGETRYIQADLRRAGEIPTNPEVRGVLDFDEPVALTLIAILMLLPDEDDPWGLVRSLMDGLPSGSYIAISHPSQDFNPEAVAKVTEMSARGSLTLVPRVRDEVRRFFGDWELVDPGLVPVMAWRPDGEPPADPAAAYYWSGVARKP